MPSKFVMPVLLAAILGFALPARAAAPRVLVSIKPIHSLVAGVMEGVGTPDLLIGGALSEHNYEMKPSDAAKVERAKLIVWVGPDLETYLVNPIAVLGTHAHSLALEHAAGVIVLPARRGGLWGVDADAHGGIDPHLWLDPQNAIAITHDVAAALSQMDPADATRYRANAARQIAGLRTLEASLAAKLAPIRQQRYVVFHDAYHYFERRFGLSAAGSITVAPERPVGPRRVAELRQFLLSGHARCIFREPQFPPKLIATISEGTKVRIGVLDPLGAELTPGPRLYGTLLDNLADSLVKCLR